MVRRRQLLRRGIAAGGFVSITTTAASADHRRVLTDGAHRSGSDLLSDGNASVDDCSDLGTLHERSDLDALRVDGTNPGYFSRNDEQCSPDSGRITRNSTVDPVSLVYSPDGRITDFTVEAHQHEIKGGKISFQASPDGGTTWFTLSTSAEQYCDVERDWRNVEYTPEELPPATDQLRIDLLGGDVHWSPQIGHVTIEVDEDAPTVDTLVDDCSGVELLHDSSDTDRTQVDRTNPGYFSRNDGTCSTDETRLTRAGTTDTVSLVYAPGGEILDYTIETHSQAYKSGEVKLYASSDGGTTWARLFPETRQYCAVTAGWQHAEHRAVSLPSGADRLRIDLVDGAAAWAEQVGHVVLEYDASSTI